MSRSSPYLHRPPPTWDQDIEEMNDMRFFLLSKVGPTVFVVKNTSDTTFKIIIGDPQMCTCGGGMARGKLCHHLLFIMIKVLRIPKDNPLSWQLSLMDSEVDQILSGQVFLKRSSTSTSHPTTRTRLHPFLRKGHGLKRSANASSSSSNGSNAACEECTEGYDCSTKSGASSAMAHIVQRKDLSDDPICCICQDEMTEDDMENDILCYCDVLCGANFHRQCFRMYATYNRSEKRPILCPLCRSKWIKIPDLPNPKSKFKSMTTKSSKKKMSASEREWMRANIQCRECNLRIQDEVHRCANCPKPPFYDLCERCFHGGNYFLTQHSRCTFVKKKKKIGSARARGRDDNDDDDDGGGGYRWQPAISAHARRVRTRDLMNRELDPNGDYNFLLSLDDEDRPNIATHLLNAVKTIKNYHGCDEDGGDTSTRTNDLVCSICSESLIGSISLKVLGCRGKHVAHESCVLQLLVESEADERQRRRGGATSAECPQCRSLDSPSDDSLGVCTTSSSSDINRGCLIFPHLNWSGKKSETAVAPGSGRDNDVAKASRSLLSQQQTAAPGSILPSINTLSLTGRTMHTRGKMPMSNDADHGNNNKENHSTLRRHGRNRIPCSSGASSSKPSSSSSSSRRRREKTKKTGQKDKVDGCNNSTTSNSTNNFSLMITGRQNQRRLK